MRKQHKITSDRFQTNVKCSTAQHEQYTITFLLIDKTKAVQYSSSSPGSRPLGPSRQTLRLPAVSVGCVLLPVRYNMHNTRASSHA